MGKGATELVDLLVLIGMGAVLPLGLALIDEPGLARIRRLWPLAAVPGVLSLWLPRGALAAGPAVVYALGTLVLALHAPLRLARTRSLAPAEVAVLTALAAPSVAGVALVAERSGYPLFGFEPHVLALTVPHFHYAGFTAALVSGLVCRADRGSRPARCAALSVPAGTLLVLAGYFLGNWWQFAGAVVLSTGMWLVGLVSWRELRPRARDRATARLFAVSSAILALTMLLALWWALGRAAGLPHPTLTWMAATHGLGNALGFALCALLAWRRITTTVETPR
ncbi:YndJ family protein [Kitasatospora cathayae]|uniref:YndJ family protein n=1 Tax=Kitasatospora cathayae TaxID=3004092 RepID=A0ABY7QAC7_9ACTN|nr:YndJ family protein [Kitasatospora sp. HUAS 3-15]WBP89717.1 YndJ family protein [Kitasatospora sp. HUAS 3-15]